MYVLPPCVMVHSIAVVFEVAGFECMHDTGTHYVQHVCMPVIDISDWT